MNALRDLGLLSLLTFALVLPIAHWGIPRANAEHRTHAWGNDDQVPLAPLAELHNALIETKPDRNVAYPMFHYLLLGAAYAPYLGALWLSGDLEQPSDAYPYGLKDPERAFVVLTWIGRSLSILLALACVGGTYWTARTLWSRRAGLLSGLCWLFAFPYVYYAPLGNPDGAMLAWTSLGLAATAEVIRHGLTPMRAALLGTFVACAGATKDQSAANFALVAPVLLALHFASGASHRWRSFEGRFVGPAVAGVSLLAAFVLASGIPLDPQRFIQHVSLVMVGGPGLQTFSVRYPMNASGMLAQAADLASHLTDVLGLLLIPIAIGLAISAARDRRALTLVLSSLGMLLVLMPVRLSRIHYLLSVALPLCPFAGLAFSRLWSRAPVAVAAIAVASTLGWHGLRTLDLIGAMREDSRYAAHAWLEEHARPGDTILSFGAKFRNPHLPAGLTALFIENREDGRGLLERHRPAFVLVQPDDTNQDRDRIEWRRGPNSVRSDYLDGALWRDLVSGAVGYRLAAQFQSPRWIPWAYRPPLSYPSVNPPVQIFVRDQIAVAPGLTAWEEAPHNPPVRRVNEPPARVSRE